MPTGSEERVAGYGVMGQTFASGHVLGLFDVTTDFRPGVHEWGLWDAQIQDVLDWTVE